MQSDSFRPHGDVEAFYNDQEKLLYVDLTGPFNLEFFTFYEETVSPIRDTIGSRYWASLINTYGLALGPIHAIEVARGSIANAVSAGLTASAIIINNKEGLRVQRTFWSQIFANTGVKLQFYKEIDAAKQWLAAEVAMKFANNKTMSFKEPRE